ncbi:hypothetical protein MPSEU_000251800 [Mayamaea pseudoterrestris]|nr:hypothetical protein MPSEU_000251800 [Mayamaea pseudoterrestris]
MSPPTFYSAARKDGHKRSVFSSTSLGSIDSQNPVSPNTNAPWDSETDHILSFFLGGGGEQAATTAVPDFASTHHTGNVPQTLAPPAREQPQQSRTGLSHLDQMQEDEEDEAIPPPTPAVHFYAPTHAFLSGAFNPRPALPSTGTAHYPKQHEMHLPPTGEMTSASSSSSLSSMTATLIGGGGPGYPPVHAPHQYVPHSHQHQLQHQQQLQQQHEQHMRVSQMHSQLAGLRPSLSTGSFGSHPSPISPAALIGQVHENLMLPPARQGQSPLQQYHGHVAGSGAPSMSDQQQRHLAWLRDLNAMAKASSAQPTSSHARSHIGPPPSSPPKQVTFQNMLPQGMIFPPDFVVSPPETKVPPVETAEKRAKRLERNRESARKSRRRKKERLSTLEAQVSKLHGKIEAERRTQIIAMVSKLRKARVSELARIIPDLDGVRDPGLLAFVIATTGPCSDIVRSVQDFQHGLLKQLVLPRYHKLLLWLTVQPETFFTAGKEEYISRMERLELPTPKVSSKQIGDELTNGPKILELDGENLRAAGTKRVTFQDTMTTNSPTPEPAPQVNLTTYANDAARVWPLLSYEIGLGVDQEEKFVLLRKRAQRGDETIPVSYPQMTAAVISTDSLREATDSLSRAIGQREAHNLVDILNPGQVLAYKTWLSSNRDRCVEFAAQHDTGTAYVSIDSSLHDICRRLNHVMKISMNESQEI